MFHTLRKMEEGFYSDEGVRRLEQAIRGEDEMETDADCDADDEKEADTERAAEDEPDTELERNAEESGKTKKNVDKSDGNSERTFGKPGRDSEKPRENAPVTAGKSSGISHANLEEAKENATTTVEKLREDSSAITGKAREKTQENKGAVWENNQNSKENPRQSTE